MTPNHTSRYRSNRPAYRRMAAGFTLVELIIVVLIIAVLAAIAYPAYQDSVVKTRRGAAKSCLLESELFMQRFFTTNLRYNQTLAGVAVALPACAAGTDVTNHYNVALTAVAARTYTLTATPQGLQAAKDTACGTLSINQVGAKTKTGTETLDYCW
ncbi:MAG: type IV pilin protein [Lysobacteraceae bacterium]